MVSRPINGGGLAGGLGAPGGRGTGMGTSGRGGAGLGRWTGLGRWSPGIGLLLFCAGSFLLFFPILGRTFVSDDFEVMQRVAKGDFRTPGFFRPLSDLSLYLNFLLGGLHPAGYYLFNILVHGINAWLVWRFSLKWPRAGDEGMQRNYAVLAALLFLAYPFHNEGIAWVLGRGASLAALFGLMVLVIVADGGRMKGKKIILAAILYFIGMMAYESVVLLPLICFVILIMRGAGRKEMIRWAAVLGVVLIVHLTLRIVVADGILGEYGHGFFGSGWRRYVENFGDVGLRLFMPPAEDRRVMEYETVGLMLLCLGSLWLFYRRSRDWPNYGNNLRGLLFVLAAAAILPEVAAVSSRTSESDRLLYFPSVFLCCMIAYVVVALCRKRGWLLIVSVLLLGYMVFFLEKNNGNWLRASAIVRDILYVTAAQPAGGRLFVINLPDENDGAYIFREGYREAVLLGGRDTAGLVVVNHLTRKQCLSTPDSIAEVWVHGSGGAEGSGERGGNGDSAGGGGRIPGGGTYSHGEMYIAPGVTIRRWGRDSLQLEYNDGSRLERGSGQPGGPAGKGRMQRFWLVGKEDRILYWNKKRLEPVLFR